MLAPDARRPSDPDPARTLCAALGASARPDAEVFAPLLLEMLQTAVVRRHGVEQSLTAAQDRIAWLEDAWSRERAARDAITRGAGGQANR